MQPLMGFKSRDDGEKLANPIRPDDVPTSRFVEVKRKVENACVFLGGAVRRVGPDRDSRFKTGVSSRVPDFRTL